MSYEQYDHEIVLRYGVQVVGWPSSIPFTSPSKIFSVTDLITLRDAWRAKTCRWVRLSPIELTKFKKEVEAKEAAAGGKKLRKKRSDAGKKRKRSQAGKGKGGEENDQELDEDEEGDEGEEEDEEEEEDEDEDLSPHRLKKPRTYKSKEFISESDEE